MSVLSIRRTITTSPTLVSIAATDPGSRRAVSLTVINRGIASIDLGDSAIATGAGMELRPSESVALDLLPGDGGLYGVAASGTVRVDVLQVGP